MTAPPPHQHRVLDEKRELDERLTRLNAFISTTGGVFGSLASAEQERLMRQAELMAALSAVLAERIAAF